MLPFPENYVSPEVFIKLNLTSQQKLVKQALLKVDVDIDVDANAGVTCEHGVTVCSVLSEHNGNEQREKKVVTPST